MEKLVKKEAHDLLEKVLMNTTEYLIDQIQIERDANYLYVKCLVKGSISECFHPIGIINLVSAFPGVNCYLTSIDGKVTLLIF